MQPSATSASANAQAIREALAAAKRRCVRSPHIDWRREDPVTGLEPDPFTWLVVRRQPNTGCWVDGKWVKTVWVTTDKEMVGIRVHPYNKGKNYEGFAGRRVGFGDRVTQRNRRRMGGYEDE